MVDGLTQTELLKDLLYYCPECTHCKEESQLRSVTSRLLGESESTWSDQLTYRTYEEGCRRAMARVGKTPKYCLVSRGTYALIIDRFQTKQRFIHRTDVGGCSGLDGLWCEGTTVVAYVHIPEKTLRFVEVLPHDR